jgi:hypothetical protein
MPTALSALCARNEEAKGSWRARQRRSSDAFRKKNIVFGSVANGRIHSSNDLDLLAIMPVQMSGRKWMGKIYEEIDRQVDSDILAFTEEELEKALPVSRFLRNVLASGKVIYEKRSTS